MARTNRDVVKGLVCGMIGLILLLLDRMVPAPWW
jgi:hypothetical protein